jgi:polysaccharide export outer membrane protein
MTIMKLPFSLIIALGLLSAATPSGAQPAAPQSPTRVQKNDARGDAATYVIGPDDILSIYVFDEPDLNQTQKYRVDSDGMVTFPLVGRVGAAGLTLREFQDRLIARLAEGYIKNPQLRVDVDSYKSQYVYVSGEVRTPTKVPMSGPTISLIDALTMAGSPTAQASNELIVVHPKKARPGQQTSPDDADAVRTKVNIKDLEIGKAGLDIQLQAGDTVFVPKAQMIYITGMVKNTGTFVLDPGMNVQQALALAGGLTDRGSDRRISISRMVDNTLVTIKAKLTDIVQPGDTILVGQRLF